MYIELLYTEKDFHIILGFKFSTQSLVFTLNLRKGSLHKHNCFVDLSCDAPGESKQQLKGKQISEKFDTNYEIK